LKPIEITPIATPDDLIAVSRQARPGAAFELQADDVRYALTLAAVRAGEASAKVDVPPGASADLYPPARHISILSK